MLAGLLIATVGGFFYFRYTQKQLHEFKVTFFDVGQGDATFIQFENGDQMLVDCGADRKVLARLGKTMPFYDRTIDYLMVTHPDLDHYGGCVDVLKRYEVKKIVVNGKTKEDEYWREWERGAMGEGAEIITMASPTVWIIASTTLEFISPDPGLKFEVKADDSNNYSIAFKLTHGSESFLLTADMEAPLEKALIKKYCSSTAGVETPGAGVSRMASGCSTLRADILKVGHHGSDTSSGEDFISAVRPNQAIISVGKRNTYGHPSRRVLKRFERAGVEILRTDQRGDIVVR